MPSPSEELAIYEPDYAIFKKLNDMVTKRLGFDHPASPLYFKRIYPQRLWSLRFMNATWLLRETGDYEAYLQIAKAIDALDGNPETTPEHKLAEWLADEMPKLRNDVPPPAEGKPRLMIGMMVWGDYVDKLINVLIPSWRAPGNLKESTHEIFFHIITFPENYERIQAALGDLGTVIFNEVPEPLTHSRVVDTYWMIGSGAALHLSQAKRLGAAFHHAFPDHVYCNHYFTNLEKLAKVKRNILWSSFRTDEKIMNHLLTHYRKDDAIDINAADLCAISLNAIHIVYYFHRVNEAPFGGLPLKHHMLFESYDTLTLICPHWNPAYLHADTIAGLKDRYYASLDSELQFLCKGYDFYIPKREDNLYCAEMSYGGKDYIRDHYCSKEAYHNFFWNFIKMADSAKFFFDCQEVPISRHLRTFAPLFKNEEVKEIRDWLESSLIATDPFKDKPIAFDRAHVRKKEAA